MKSTLVFKRLLTILVRQILAERSTVSLVLGGLRNDYQLKSESSGDKFACGKEREVS